MLHQIVTFLDDYLDTDAIDDAAWNGLQVEGGREVRSVLCAVDAGAETFQRAIALNADLVVVHHGLFWKGANPSVTGWAKTRIDLLTANGISLYASHLPLDRHPEVGNNAQLLKLLGATITGEFLHHRGKNIGWTGVLPDSRPLTSLVKCLDNELTTACKVISFGKASVATLAVASGGTGIGDFHEALQCGVDAYITGETSEIYHAAKDAGMNVIFAGHHASEILGVKALAAVLGQRFGVRSEFADIPTGL